MMKAGLMTEMIENHREDAQTIFYHSLLVFFDYGCYEEMLNMLDSITDDIDETFQGYEIYCYVAYAAMELGDDERALKNLRKAIDHEEPHLSELFEERFPGVRADELYDYYYNKVYGSWPEDD